jgi:hypothetical protein
MIVSLPRKTQILYLILVLSTGSSIAQTSGVPECGIAEVLVSDSFEDGVIPPAVLAAESTALTLNVDARFRDATYAQSHIDLYGQFTGPASTGISVNQEPALIVDGQWLIRELALNEGSNEFTVTATTLEGSTQTQTVRIQYAPPSTPPLTEFRLSTASTYAPGFARFEIDIADGYRLLSSRFDFDGNGSDELLNPNISDGLLARYTLPGFYRARATLQIDDADPLTPPITQVHTQPVLLRHLGVVRYTLCQVFEKMRARLLAGNIPGALQTLHQPLRTPFSNLWTGMGIELPTVAAGLGFVRDGIIMNDSANYRMAKPAPEIEPDAYQLYPVIFDIGPDGVWRIGSM